MPTAAPPRRLSAETRREQILQAATQLFIERGFEAVGMADLAQALGTSRPTIYTYFSSPEAVLAALFTERLEHFPERLLPLLHGPQTPSYHQIFQALLQERELLMLLGSGGGPLFRKHRQAFLEAIEQRLNLQQLGAARAASLGSPAQPLLLPIVLTLLSTVAYEQLTRHDLEAGALALTLERFIEGGIEAVLEAGAAQRPRC